ncbi:VOC family protein [Saccharopolyspora griseoalba]|uniref:VOC family protein n=1 Tax=Saccharopolyspora griseoalba TaxID=1431848 RepID=A0ABW2LF29_9PSEU
MTEAPQIRFLEVGCRNLSRSLDFYQGLLGFPPVGEEPGTCWLDAGAARLKLVEVADGDLGGWVEDDLQCGMRHFGMRVGDVDLQAARLAEAGVSFTEGPRSAHGGVRIAFFTDPDGTLLEFVSGTVAHDKLWSPELAERDRVAGEALLPEAGPTFDHVAITVPDLDAALEFYVRTMGAAVIGQLLYEDDPRGLVITNLRLGSATLEILTFTRETAANPWNAGQARLGLRTLGFTVAEHRSAVEALTRAGAGAVMRPSPDPLLIDPDGLPLTVTTR